MKFLCVTVLLCIVVVTNAVQFVDCGKCRGVVYCFLLLYNMKCADLFLQVRKYAR